jgi:hypothetical protein
MQRKSEEMKQEPVLIDNWRIDHVFLDETMTSAAPVIKGFVDGRMKSDILLWFDLDNGIAMTKDQVFKIGDPNAFWMGRFLADGHSPEDLEIKDTTH